jgi:predicted nicotinamide N-methyase
LRQYNRAVNEASLAPESVLGSRLRPRSLPLCPELSLWLLGDDIDLNRRVAELFAVDTAPYWAFCWGSGQALARHVLDHPALVRGKRVVDFGAGCGVAAIAALRAGAAFATAVDLDPLALRAARENARLNRVSLATASSSPESYDVLLASDVLYEVGNRAWLRAELARGRSLLLSDPLRPGAPRIEFAPDAEYEAKTVPDVDYPVARAVVYRLMADGNGQMTRLVGG